MYKVNLIKGWQKTETYKVYRNRLLFALFSISLILIISYVALFLRFILLQKQVATLSNQQFLSSTGQTYTTESLTKTLYSLKKLNEIKNIYLAYPDYYLYHQFLLKQIFKFKTFTIENYSLDKDHLVKVTLKSTVLEDIFTFLTTLEGDNVSRYFESFEIGSIEMSENKDRTERSFLLDFNLKFNNLLLNEKK